MTDLAVAIRDILLATLAYRCYITPESELSLWERFAERAVIIVCLAHLAALVVEGAK